MYKFVLPGKKVEKSKTLMNEIDQLKKEIKNLKKRKETMRDDFSLLEKKIQN
jgi:phage shock protein A